MAAVVTVENLSVGYDGETILEGVSFAVEAGEILAILGRSGCGKTTLLRGMIGLLPRSGGTVHIAGEELDTSLLPTPRPFGVLFQEGALLSALTLAENVALPLEEFTDLPSDVIAEMVRLKLDLVELGASAHRRPSELSGGMLKRAGLARAMALDPQILFCDEPTAGLDPPTAAEVDSLLLELRKVLGITIVVISHELTSIRNLADRCLMLDREAKGIVARGTLRQLETMQDQPGVRSFFRRRLD